MEIPIIPALFWLKSPEITQAVRDERPPRDPGGKDPTGGSHVAAATGPGRQCTVYLGNSN